VTRSWRRRCGNSTHSSTVVVRTVRVPCSTTPRDAPLVSPSGIAGGCCSLTPRSSLRRHRNGRGSVRRCCERFCTPRSRTSGISRTRLRARCMRRSRSGAPRSSRRCGSLSSSGGLGRRTRWSGCSRTRVRRSSSRPTIFIACTTPRASSSAAPRSESCPRRRRRVGLRGSGWPTS
jgi:hypothetical protein